MLKELWANNAVNASSHDDLILCAVKRDARGYGPSQVQPDRHLRIWAYVDPNVGLICKRCKVDVFTVRSDSKPSESMLPRCL